MIRICTCGHTRDSHEHYRGGSECAARWGVGRGKCDCIRYRRPSLLAWLRGVR